MRKLALTLLIGASLAGCTTLAGSSVSTSTCASGGVASFTVLDDKAVYAAEALYNVPAYAYVSANKNGTLPASVKAWAKPKLIQLYSMLKLARAAYKAGDVAGFNCQFAAMTNLSNEVKTYIK